MKCIVEKRAPFGIILTCEAPHGLKTGDTVRLAADRAKAKAKTDHFIGAIEKIEPDAGKLVEGGPAPSIRAIVQHIPSPATLTLSSRETLTVADAQEGQQDPCDGTIDPIYYLTCCVMGLGCNSTN